MIGLILGGVLAYPVGRVMVGLIYGIRPFDPATLAALAGVLLLLSFIASFIPASKVGRFVVSRSDDRIDVAFLDDLIREHLTDLFAGSDVGEAYSVKMTRDAELYLEDEFSGNLVEMIAKSLKSRESGLPTRFLYDPRMPYPMVTHLKHVFGLEDESRGRTPSLFDEMAIDTATLLIGKSLRSRLLQPSDRRYFG